MRCEWLVTNGLGGYAAGTLGGLARRRHHGLLVAALPGPLGRTMVFPDLSERLRLDDGTLVSLTAHDDDAGGAPEGLVEFRLDNGLPVWRYAVGDTAIEKQIVLVHEQNTVLIVYRIIDAEGTARLKLRPSVHHRSHNDPVDTPLPGDFHLGERDGRYEIGIAGRPPIRMTAYGRRHAFTIERVQRPETVFPVEESRGYEHRGTLWSPGYFRMDLAPDAPAALVVSTEAWESVLALSPEEAMQAEHERRSRRLAAAVPAARGGLAGELVLAGDQFLVKPAGRTADAARARAEGEEVRTIIAGYHWFTDWGRDTMISLEGLTLVTGRHAEAREILRLFAHYVRDGLLPNLFPEGRTEGLYHTADATLWFFHALERYAVASGDRELIDELLPKLVEIAEHHLRGTRFGIGVDPADGLLRQGQAGFQLTWMDAKVDDWVVTPRRGKAVEINALWYNALSLLAGWLDQRGQPDAAAQWSAHAERAREAFNRRFYYEEGSYLYDIVDGEAGDDSALRPNQVLAIALDHPVLERGRWDTVLAVVREQLLTPVGLRSLARGHPDYRARYYGDIYSRDAAYHQGTVWPWLIGPFIDAWLKCFPADRATAHGFLEGFEAHLDEDCVGSISEIFDAEPPFTPRGCVSQAWSVAEVLRCWLATLPQQESSTTPS